METGGSKATGISSMQIKDILKILVDDGLVRCEKCGIANLYWSFSYAAQLQLDTQFNKHSKQLEEATKISGTMAIKIDKLLVTKGGIEWEKLCSMNDESQLIITDLDTQLSNLKENSTENIQKLQLELIRLETGIDILIDNITLIVNYININNGVGKDELYKVFNIPIDL